MILLGGVLGSLVVLAAVAAAVAAYLGLIRPWHVRWGATKDGEGRPMPGDGLLGPGTGFTTIAITIRAPADQVWSWLAQLGYGRAGWYSYDWLDNDGRRSAEQIRPEWQHLRPGDQILMMPGSGLNVVAVENGHFFVARATDGTTSWCLAVATLDQRERLPADQPVARPVAHHPGQRVVDRAVRRWRIHHGTEDAALDEAKEQDGPHYQMAHHR